MSMYNCVKNGFISLFFACWLAERPTYLRIPLPSYLKKASLIVINTSCNLNLELTRTAMLKYIFIKRFEKNL